MNKQSKQRRNCIGRTVWLSWALLILLPAMALADVREPGRIRLARESLQAALPGQPYAGVVEFTSPQDGVVETVEIGGVGWAVGSVEFSTAIDVKRGETIRIPFQADVNDGALKLEIRVTVNGKVVEKKFDLSPERIAAIGKDRPSTRVDDVAAVPQSEGSDGPGPRGCDDYLLRVRGRIEYIRQDGLVVGVDGIRFQIMDEDSIDSEVIYEGLTDEQGAFDVTTCWDDCDITGCDDPDVYLRYECNTGVAFVRSDDAGEDIYAWSTIDTLIFNDFTGGDIDFGSQRPTDTSQFPVLHIHNSIVRAHRYVVETNGYVSAQVGVVWRDGNGAFYQPTPDEIHIGADRQWNEGTHVHEWGHHLVYEWTSPPPPGPNYCNGFCDDPASTVCGGDQCIGGGGHCIWCNETDTDAWGEGFPDWLASVLLRIWQARYNAPPPLDGRDTLESVLSCCDGAVHNALITEGLVGALLRDIEDPAQDAGQTVCPQDSLALGGDEILAVVREYQPIRVTAFINAFRTEFPQYEHDFRSTAQSIAAVYVAGLPPLPPLQVFATGGCGTYRTGETITLTVQSNASRYSTCMRWQRNGSNLADNGRVSGATTDTLTITNAIANDAGNYTLRISSCDGAPPNECNGTQSITSAPIRVPILSADEPAHRVTGWGSNGFGALGRGSDVPISDVNPADVINLNNVVAISAGYFNSFAILSDGTVWGWGSFYLGNGTGQSSATPVQVTGLSDIVALSAGGYETAMALDANGHVWTWGGSFYGQLGFPSGGTLIPGQVDLDCVLDISMAYNHAAAVTSDGSLWAWGHNGAGQLGQGSFGGNFNTPQRVNGLSNVVDVECGSEHTLARLSDGTVWACGRNNQGQLGDGTLEDRNRFVQVGGLANVTHIAAGWYHSLAVRADGSPWAWGSNGNYQLGTGSGAHNPTPVRVLNLPDVRALDGGADHSAFVAADGTIWTCGYNGQGQLGRPGGATNDGPHPVDTRIGAAVQISTGVFFTMGIAPGARIIAPVTDQLVAGCATARFTVGAVGEPPLGYLWGRVVGGSFVPLSNGGRISGANTPTLTITQTDALDTGAYQVVVFNATNSVFDPVTLVTPPLLMPFDTVQDALAWWNNERGTWSVTGGAYAAGAPTDNPATYSSFGLPIRDYQIELDVTSTIFANQNTNGGIWLRSRISPTPPNYPDGVLLGFGSVDSFATGDLFWQRYPNAPQNVALNVYTPGAAIHLRVEVRGDTYTAYLNDSPTPTTTLTTPNYPSGSIGLYDNAAAGVAFDNVFVQSLTSCDPGSGMEPVRILQRPLSQTVPSGSQVTLSVIANGTGPLGHQWLRNGSCVAGANSPTHAFTASAVTAGRYECTVTNACGSVGSFPAHVTVEGGGPAGDIDGDGHVSLADLAILLSCFGSCVGDPAFNPQADFDADGCVGLSDLAVLLSTFGQ